MEKKGERVWKTSLGGITLPLGGLWNWGAIRMEAQEILKFGKARKGFLGGS